MSIRKPNSYLLIGSTDMGTGSDTILAQMAADVLQTSMENIIVHASDTDISPYDPGSYAGSLNRDHKEQGWRRRGTLSTATVGINHQFDHHNQKLR